MGVCCLGCADRAVMDAAMRHRALYKGTTPPWKETYRKRCVERLKSNRSRLLDTFRQVGERINAGSDGSSLVQEVMEEEWKAMQFDSGRLPSLWRTNLFSQDTDELETLEEIKRELLLEEQAMVLEIENILQFEEECMDSVVGMSTENHIVCPVCNFVGSTYLVSMKP
ncbi:RPA-interacting protein isoform X2 [Hyperolius riggenbachi]|uniref:RPA-interacting protein isoform X2 n=1 Tax=Hyperolius riggenbachi TaxID=752182 RepID=UPI0035A2A165